MKQGMRWLAVAGVLTLVAAACSNNDNSGGGSTGGGGGSTGPTAIDTIGTGEGAAEPDRVAGLHREVAG